MDFKKLVIILFTTLSFMGCNNKEKKSEETKAKPELEKVNVDTIHKTQTSSYHVGNYVSADYEKRNEGYDWISVVVSDAGNDNISIKVRSRADKKKPTCTFDAIGNKIDTNTYKTIIDGSGILFQFKENEIIIKPEKDEDQKVLYFYCSGGASLGETYTKISQDLDQNQIDKTKFHKTLNLQDVGFNISSIEKDGKNNVTIFTFGLAEREYNETFNIDGEEVIDAEVEDLNADGSPELFIYTQSFGSGSYGNVYAFSVNNKKSMSEVYFQPTEENNEINQGYNGYDQFSLVETNLMQRFPIFENETETNKMRQVRYKLEDGEAMRKLVVKDKSEYQK